MRREKLKEFGPGYSPARSSMSMSNSNDLVEVIGDLESKLWSSNTRAADEWDNYADDLLRGKTWDQLESYELSDAIEYARSLMKKYSIREDSAKKIFRISKDIKIGNMILKKDNKVKILK